MLELDIIGAWDARAVNLDQEEADRNVYEFDLTLWNLLSTLAKERPDDAASQFSLGMDTVQKLSLATPSQLEALASGVLISFKLETAEQNIITRLSGDYDPVVFINHSVDEFDAAYWLLFNRVALNRPGFPGECFICELRLPDHRFRWKHNKLFLLLPEGYDPAFPAIVDCYTSPPT
ncbi:hypothetical protein [Escherichia coli]